MNKKNEIVNYRYTLMNGRRSDDVKNKCGRVSN